jgi:tetratricopeptide (TPR) repeat protein
MNFFRRFFGTRRPGPASPGERSRAASKSMPTDKETAPPAAAQLFGRPEEDTPMVMVTKGSTMIIMDRLSYEYQQGRAKGTDPSQSELDGVLAKVDRVRILSGGMMRDHPLGTDVLLDTRNRADIAAFREALRVEEDPGSFGHCGCLGGPTAECYAAGRLVAALSFHHGHALRWYRWKHDARLHQPEMLLSWLGRHGIEPDPMKGSEDSMQLQLLALKESDRLAYRAQSHLVRGEQYQALEDCGKALGIDPKCAIAFGVRALVHNASQRPVECEADCNAAVGLGFEHPEVYFARAVARHAKGELDEAKADCDAALALAPGHPGVYNSRGLIRAQMGRTVEALADFGKAIELATKWPLPLANRAALHAQTGALNRAVADYTAAIRILEEAAKENPAAVDGSGGYSLSAYYGMRGFIHQRMGELGAADDDYDRAVELDPDDPRVFLARGQFAFETGRPDAAITDYSEVIRLRPDLVDGYLQRAQVRIALDDRDEALDDLNEAARWSPDNLAVLLQRGQLLLQAERYDDARRDLDAIIRLEPEQMVGYYLRSYCWNHCRDYVRKRDDLEQAILLAPDWSDPRNSLAWLLATCPDPSIRDGPRAVEMGRRALQLSTEPGRAGCLDTLAAALAENGEFAEAIVHQREAISLMDDLDRRIRYEGRLSLYEDGEPYHEEPEE